MCLAKIWRGLYYLLVVKLNPDLVCQELSHHIYSFNDFVIHLYS